MQDSETRPGKKLDFPTGARELLITVEATGAFKVLCLVCQEVAEYKELTDRNLRSVIVHVRSHPRGIA